MAALPKQFCNSSLRLIMAAATTLALLSGCASEPANPTERAVYEKNNDPLEPLNRDIFAFNQGIDQIVLTPVSKVYITLLPGRVRLSLRHFYDNLHQPVVFANNMLQAKFSRAGITGGRFIVNSTAGVVGLFDVAGDIGLPQQTGDFGQTLDSWGSPEGPYLILPVLGPSNPRDAIGLAVDSYADPFRYVAANYDESQATTYRELAEGIDRRAGAQDALDDMKRNSLDFYATLRSVSRQYRNAELGKPTENLEDPNDHP